MKMSVQMSSNDITNESIMLVEACNCIPKVELHAHFFGSIKPSTIRRIAATKTQNADHRTCSEGPLDETDSSLFQRDKPDLDAAFKYFNWIYSVVKTEQDMQQALIEVLEDFHKDNVVYLELRSSLKRIPEEGVDPQRYVDMLVEGCKSAETKWGMTVRLIVSLDRAKMKDEENARLQVEDAFTAATRHPDYIVGFDIAGRPDAGDITYILRRLKEEVLEKDGKFFGTKKITIHTAEVEDDGGDTQKILELPPHRVGHGLYLNEEQQAFVAQQGICVEVCPTSNMCTLKLKDMLEHPLQLHCEKEVDLNKACICTDDTGLFQTSLSKELQIVASAYKLTPSALFDMQRVALEAAFCTSEVKTKLYNEYFNDSAKNEFIQKHTKRSSS